MREKCCHWTNKRQSLDGFTNAVIIEVVDHNKIANEQFFHPTAAGYERVYTRIKWLVNFLSPSKRHHIVKTVKVGTSSLFIIRRSLTFNPHFKNRK